MNWIEKEIELLERIASDVQNRYPDSNKLPSFMAFISSRIGMLKQELRQIESFIEDIPDQTVREIACLRLLEGMTYREIGEIMQYSSRHVARLWKPYRDLFNGKKSTGKR